MPFFTNAAHDAALAVISGTATLIHFCSTEPANLAGVAAVSLGSAVPTFGAPRSTGTPPGRKMAVTTGAANYTSSGTVGFYAIVSGTNLLVTNAIAATKAVNSGDAIAATVFDIILLDPVSA